MGAYFLTPVAPAGGSSAVTVQAEQTTSCAQNRQSGAGLSLEHRMRIGATHLGISFEAYRARIEAGLKWCSGHRDWHPREVFAIRTSAADGLDNHCRELVNARAAAYQRRIRAADPEGRRAYQNAQKRAQRVARRGKPA